MGAAVELSGHSPHFPQPGEAARSALLRLRPQLALIDCDHEEACAESFVGPALMTDAKVVLVRSRRTERDASELARRLDLTVVDMPAEHETLIRILRQTLTP
jgi:hypothetical protein